MIDYIEERFSDFTKWAAKWLGSPGVFLMAQLVVILWALFGNKFKWSADYVNCANFYLSYVAYAMMFIIQNTQNRDSRALHLKLDEIIRSNADARNDLMKAEDLKESELKILEAVHQEV